VVIGEGEGLAVESLMPASGMIFSDAVETNFLEFNSGAIAHIGVSRQRARLVVPSRHDSPRLPQHLVARRPQN